MMESKEALYLISRAALKHILKEENLQSQSAIMAGFNENKAALSQSPSCLPNGPIDFCFMKPI